MSPRVRPVEASDFDLIHRHLLTSLNPRIPRERWSRLFEWGWENPEGYIGIGLFDSNQCPVGFVSTIFSRQPLDGTYRTVCNLSSWIVKPAFRSSALGLIMPVLSRRDVTVTNLTTVPSVGEMFRRLGFRILETHVLVFHAQNIFRTTGQGGLIVKTPHEVRSLSLPTHMERIWGDHRHICGHWVLTSGTEHCYIAFTVGRRLRLRTVRVHYLSNPQLFVAGLPTLQRRAIRSFMAPFLECDWRLLQEARTTMARKLPLQQPRLFRSEHSEANQISNLYSELPLLGF